MAVVQFQTEVTCAAPRERLWPIVCNTDRLNRHIGSNPLDVRAISTGSFARFEMTTKIGPVVVTYQEEPFEWREEEYFSFRRDFLGGPNRSVFVRYDLTDRKDGGCTVSIQLEATPRYAVAYPVVWYFSRENFQEIIAFIVAADRQVSQSADLVFEHSAPNDREITRLHEDLRDRIEPGLAERVTGLIRSGADVDVRRIRPFELAASWGADRTDTLCAFLDATALGLTSLQWGVMCPSCRTDSETLPSLSDLGTEAHCQACDIRFGVDLDRVVEATFAPHPAVRTIESRPFCIAGPGLMPHIIEQQLLPRRQSVTLSAPTEEGRYRLFARGGALARVEVGKGGSETADIHVVAVDRADGAAPRSDDGLQLVISETSPRFDVDLVELAPGATLRVHGDDTDRHVKLERTDIWFQAATAHQVSTLPRFRALFGGEALRPGLSLSVGRASVLFSDLCDSTALYSDVGDAAAFGVVTDALRFGRAAVELRGGLVVKTMGDAIMAVFDEPQSAVDAATAMLVEWSDFQKRHHLADRLALKIGIFDGPCTMVSANGALDYFGQTVNRAARVQNLAGPGELVLAEDVADRCTVSPHLVERERFATAVKGIVTPMSLVRLGRNGGAPEVVAPSPRHVSQ